MVTILVFLAGAAVTAAVAWYAVPRLLFDPIVRRMLRPPIRAPRALAADLAARSEDVTIPGRDLPMKGWLLRPDGEARGLVAFIHGWSSDGGRMAPLARPSVARGLACLLVDLPGHGRTGPIESYNAARMQDDFASVAAWIASRDDLAGLSAGILGYSFGGLGALVAASRDRRWRAGASIAAPSGPTRATELYLSSRGLPGVLLGRALKRSLTRIVGVDPDLFDGPRNLAAIESRVLVIHGIEDRVVPVGEARILVAAVPEGRGEVAVIDGRGHGDLMEDADVAAKVAAFFEQELARRGTNDAAPAAR